MRTIVQHAVLVTVQPQIVRYTCDFCGAVCGTRQNPKATWYMAGSGTERHYCKKTCHPGKHPYGPEIPPLQGPENVTGEYLLEVLARDMTGGRQ